MFLGAIDKKIRDAFSDAAVQYDVLASLHREIGRELTAKIRKLDVDGWIVDVGMGTGWFTNRMKHFFPECRVAGIDFSAPMIAQSLARDEIFSRIQADANRLPLREESVRLITSNLAYQWVTELLSAFKQCHRVLQKDGHLAMTMFGYSTFQELFEALNHVRNSSTAGLRRLAGTDEIREALAAAGFRDVSVDYERIKVRYPDMLAIVKWIKDIGANAQTRNFFVGKDLLARAGEYYDKTYRDRLGVYTTFEVIWVEARK